MGVDTRDTDWTTVVVGPTGQIEWILDAEQGTYGFLLRPNDCRDVAILETLTIVPCFPLSLTLSGEPGDVLWLWVGPTSFFSPNGFIGHEFDYISTFSGWAAGTVANEKFSFDGIKSLYR